MNTLTEKICTDIRRRANEKLANVMFDNIIEGGLTGAGSTAISHIIDTEEDEIEKNKKRNNKNNLFGAIVASGLLGALGGAVAAYKL